MTKTNARKSGVVGKRALKDGAAEMFRLLCKDRNQTETDEEERSAHAKPAFKSLPLCHDFK